MPQKNSFKKKGGNRKNTGKRTQGPSSKNFSDDVMTKYTGRLMIPSSLNQDHVVPVNFSYYFPLNATVGGVIDNVYGEASVAAANDWNNIANSFHEFRVIMFQMDYVPLVSYTTNYPPFITVIDRGVNASLGAYTAAANHESAMLWSSRYPKKIKARMDGVEEADWQVTSGAVNHYYIKQYGSGFTASQNVGNILFTYLVQFRGRA
jgi:hypothetical protein